MAGGRQLLLDANLLLVWVVGSVDIRLLDIYERTSGYSEEDFQLLSDYMQRFDTVLVLPNTLTEVYNLLGKLKGDHWARAMNVLATGIGVWPERFVPSRSTVGEPEFGWLGLTDTAIIIAAAPEAVQVATADAKLYRQLLVRGASAVNFTHIRTKDWL